MSRKTIAWIKAGISKVSRPRTERDKGSFLLFLGKTDAKYVFIICLEIKMWRTDFFWQMWLKMNEEFI
jgi:hypothetical protein